MKAQHATELFSSENDQLVELVEEITARLQAGDSCDIETYAARYPEYADRLRDWMTVMSAMADLGHSLAVGAASRAAHPASNISQADGCAVGIPATSIEHPASKIGLLGDFRIVREIGRGGMGVVYEAEQISIGRRVALKVLPFAAMLDKQQLNRFKNEARAAGTLDHPNIVAIHSVGVERGVHYYAMQLIEGQSLAEVVDHLRKFHLPLPLGEGRGEGHCDEEGRGEGVFLPFPPGEGRGEGKQQCNNREEQQRSSAVDQSAIRNPQSEIPSPRPPVPSPDTAPIAHLSTLPAFDTREFFRAIAQLGMQAAEALDHAHQNGILHRDIKPANLLLECSHHAPRDEIAAVVRRGPKNHHVEDRPWRTERDDYTLKLWITDFGLARIEQDAGMTMTGDILGTLRYMSPEQALAKRVVVDHRSDIYSLGVTLYELLTLQPAFTGDDRHELLRQIAFEEPRKLRQVSPRIPHDLETIVLKAMEKNPEERYTTAHELAGDLRRFLEFKPIVARPPGLMQRIRKWSQRHTAVIACLASVLAISCSVLGVSAFILNKSYNDAKVQKEAAEREASRALANFDQAIAAIDKMLVRLNSEKLSLSTVPETLQLRRELLEEALALCDALRKQNGEDQELSFRVANIYGRIGQSAAALNEQSLAQKAMNARHEISLDWNRRIANNENLIRIKLMGLSDALRYSHVIGERQTARFADDLMKALSEFRTLPPSDENIYARVDAVCTLARCVHGTEHELPWRELAHELLVLVDAREGRIQARWPGVLHVFYFNCALVLPGLDATEQERLMNRAAQVARTAGHQMDCAFYQLNLQNLLRELKRFDEARSCIEEAQGILEKCISDSPEVARPRMFFASSYWDLGKVERASGRLAEAELALREGIRVSHEVVSLGLYEPARVSLVASQAIELAEILELQGKHDFACDIYDDEIQFWRSFGATADGHMIPLSFLMRGKASLLHRMGKTLESLQLQRVACNHHVLQRDRNRLRLAMRPVENTALKEVEDIIQDETDGRTKTILTGMLHVRRGQTEAGVRMIREFKWHSNETDVPGLMFLAIGEARLGNRDAACAALARAFVLAPNEELYAHIDVEELLPEVCEALDVSPADPLVVPPWRKVPSSTAEPSTPLLEPSPKTSE